MGKIIWSYILIIIQGGKPGEMKMEKKNTQVKEEIKTAISEFKNAELAGHVGGFDVDCDEHDNHVHHTDVDDLVFEIDYFMTQEDQPTFEELVSIEDTDERLSEIKRVVYQTFDEFTNCTGYGCYYI